MNRLRVLRAGIFLAFICFGSWVSAGLQSETPPDGDRLSWALSAPEDLEEGSMLAKRFAALAPELNSDSTSRDTLQALAYLCHANELHERARVLYDWLIDSSVDEQERARLNYLAAQLVKERGFSEEAEKYLQASVSAYDGYALALSQLGEARFKLGDWESAESLYERAKRIDSKLVSAYVGAARVFEQRGQLEQAVEELESVLEFDPESSPALALLSQFYARMGDLRRAYETSESIAYSSSPPEKDSWYEEVKQSLFDVQRLDFLFLDYFMVGQYDKAEPFLERMESIEPDNPRWSQYRAILYMKNGYHGKAEREVLKGIENGGDSDVFYPLLVKTMSLRGLLRKAEATAREAMETYGESGDLSLELAHLLVARQDLDGAISSLDKGLVSDPYNLELHFLRARLSMSIGQGATADESLAMVRQLAPMDAEALVRAALILMEVGRFSDALPFLQQSRKAAPYDGEALELLSDAYFEIGRVAQGEGDMTLALEHFNRSLELSPKRLDALSARVQAAVESGRLEDAEIALQGLLSVAGGKPSLLLIYGDILFRLGKVSEARTNWRIALARLGDSEREEQLQRKLTVRLEQSSAFVRGGE